MPPPTDEELAHNFTPERTFHWKFVYSLVDPDPTGIITLRFLPLMRADFGYDHIANTATWNGIDWVIPDNEQTIACWKLDLDDATTAEFVKSHRLERNNPIVILWLDYYRGKYSDFRKGVYFREATEEERAAHEAWRSGKPGRVVA